MILVGDIGGTHTRFALACRKDSRWQLEQLQVLPTVPDIGAAIRSYLRSTGNPALEAVACCGAGPLDLDGRIQLTNSRARLDPALLSQAADAAVSILVNDFAAIARAIPELLPDQLAQVGGGERLPQAPRVVIGAGTGLGVAALVYTAGTWVVIPGEGGHADLAPVDEDQAGLWSVLRKLHGRVSAETVLSGPGLERLFSALNTGNVRVASEIAQAAWQGEAMACRVVRLFTQSLGSFAGNLALTLGARGGVYLAGGIVPGWGGHFDQQLFRQSFEDKPPFHAWLAQVPSFIVTHPQPGLYGLAVLASHHLSKAD